ncbi:MAG: phospho-sugar mutase [Acidimicrobiales bacterium]
MTHSSENEPAAEIARWIAIDDEYRAELTALQESDPAELGRLFDGRIAFGTAGLRAAMGPGPRQMNRVVVRQTTAGLMDWLPAGAKVVIGYDARHNSNRFALDVAEVVAAKGGTAELIDRAAPTPILALAVLDQQADAGVMITASHNPATDNGYKLYLADGIQLVDPADAEIAAAIDEVAAASEQTISPAASGAPVDISAKALAAHQKTALAALMTEHRQVGVLYSAMHGVGGQHLLHCFAAAGFPEPKLVAEQFEPDPEFPTAPFPNPEEPGAFDLAYATIERLQSQGDGDVNSGIGRDSGIDIILANDPDADRLAVGVVDDCGAWVRLSGDEVGALLADHILRHRPPPAGSSIADPAIMASSIVSSRFIDRLAASAGVESVRTLTGFKWVARPIVDRPDERFLLGYEEALGYCIGDRVRDKDGISAALVMAELAAECKAEGITVYDRLNQIVERHGLFATSQVTVSIAKLDDAGRDAAKSRAVSLEPEAVGGVAVQSRVDLSLGETLPPTSGVVLNLADGSRVIVRPSGTEPKIKAYLEVIEEIQAGEPESSGRAENAKEARRRAELRLKDLASAIETLLTS